jgi:hypothetical protein
MMAVLRRRTLKSVFSTPSRLLSANSPQFWESCGLLNLRGDEDLASVKRAYYVAAVRWHPDRAGGDKERFVRMQAAYEYIRDERLSRPSRDAPRAPAWRARSARQGASGEGAPGGDESRARAHRQPRAGWGNHEESDDPPDYQQGPRTERGRWLWKAALAFITARVLILGGMKLAFGDQDREAATMQRANLGVVVETGEGADASVHAPPSRARVRRDGSDL